MSQASLCEYCNEVEGTWDEEAGMICDDCLQARQLIAQARAERYHDEEVHDTFCC